MYGKSLSENGKRVSEVEMNSIALNEAKGWADALMDSEYRGRGDREKSVRGRVSKRTGIPESYLFRLQYKTREMKDVAGSAYRALMLSYNELCRLNEEAADRHHAERMRIRGNHETADEKPAQAGLGMDSSEV